MYFMDIYVLMNISCEWSCLFYKSYVKVKPLCRNILGPVHDIIAMFLKLHSVEPQGSTKGCQGFWEMNMNNGWKILLVILSLCVQIKICVAICDTYHFVPDSMQTNNRCFNPDASWFCSQVSQQSLP
jgi:hypothetical protein